MPVLRKKLTHAQALAHLREACVTTGGDSSGIEVEWLTRVRQPRSIDELRAIAGELPNGSTVTFEPGGQLEISSRPGALGDVLRALVKDATVARRRLLDHGVQTLGEGFDHRRDVERLLEAPRYDAMEAYFDAQGPYGRRMMRRTAAIQVNVGPGPDPLGRWRLLTAIGPVLAAMFANSRSASHRSARLANWLELDPTRTAPVVLGDDPRGAWSRFVLEANVMLIRTSDERFEPGRDGFTFARWIAEGSDHGYPTLDDLAYHLTTLFPPVRARGWFELRMIDALPDPYWVVPACVVAGALAADPGLLANVAPGEHWRNAATYGLSDPVLRDAARVLMRAALDQLPALGLDDNTRAACELYAERYVEAGRTPADDRTPQRREAAA